ncbi:MAG: amidophosphoribosyltransferase [Firmicutes bacterium]|nr:amidophosphoribosyltransferase [Bacillota bacterium]MEE3382445.1 amidophosphoribosyltransferase [Anaerovoracaceae bacterium]MBQ1430161.1 amidophosphoribosyltransferase [Bacillota bacterium]MBQ1630794.1 amidophosphoribosyltransferase [Bacillota bacterium]MBQ1716142.1 amidophosphoribosyltransferase [Bacillota bacterium]
MGGFFGVVSKRDALNDVFFGVDYHSHLGTRRGGLAAFDKEGKGLQREIHNIENSPFRTKFENIFNEMKGNSVIGAISDSDPQPLLINGSHGAYAICTVGLIRNEKELIDFVLRRGGHFNAMTGGKVNSTELVATIMSEEADDLIEGVKYAMDMIEGTMSILILRDDGSLVAARDKYGRLPVLIGKNEDGYCVSFESFAYKKLGYEDVKELGPGEIVSITPDGITVLQEPGDKMRICAFLWSYYGYPNSNYEGVNVEAMRYRNGVIMAKRDMEEGITQRLDAVCGVPDSGTPHAIGYSNYSHVPFTRPFIKYTPTWPRSFMPAEQSIRNKVARMKQIPIPELIEGKKLLFVDDSIVRGTQIRETVKFLYDNGAKEVHMRSACPPIIYGCKYLNFSSSKNEMELLARRVIVELEGEEGLKYAEEYSDGRTERGKKLRKAISDRFHFDSLEFQSLEGVIEAIGIDKCKLCTYCWDGRE